jgi:SNF2 family DNA or RNA helicase
MAVLHGSWLPESQRFFLWAETWRRIAPSQLSEQETLTTKPGIHPYCLSKTEFKTLVSTPTHILDLSGLVDLLKGRWQSQVLALPSHWQTLPAPSDVAADPTNAPPENSVTENSASAPILLPLLSGPQISLKLICDLDAEPASPPDLTLFPWLVEGLWLSAKDTLRFLNTLPLGLGSEQDGLVGSDIRFWSHVSRWGLDLMARAKYIPTFTSAIACNSTNTSTGNGTTSNNETETATASWQLLLDSAIDQKRLRQFAQHMPLASRLYSSDPQAKTSFATPLPTLNQRLLRSFLQSLIDAQVRHQAQNQPPSTTANLSKELPLKEWLGALADLRQPQFENPPAGLLRLNEALHTWTAPLQNLKEEDPNQLRACFLLKPPPSGNQSGSQEWTLHYGLESADSDNLQITADTIWAHPVDQLVHQGHTILAPQETLLAGLGRASRLYEPIKQSLSQERPATCPLNPIQAFEFIKVVAWRLLDNGFGVVLPHNLVDSNDTSTNRFGLRIEASTPNRTQQRLGLQSLLNFKWQLSIGGQTVSQQEFEQLMAERTPLVEINGQWIELKPQEVKAAQEFFQKRTLQNKLTVEDVLRISTGDTQVIDKLPVVDFQASGKLQELITTLTTGNQSFAAMSEPEGFKGQLRPYQARGVSWLAFLEQWGLGACLADDMGLGKTIQLIAFLLYLKQENVLEKPILLVCPTSVLGNWQREVKRFGPTLKTLIYHGDKRPKGATLAKILQSVNLLITSYTLVFRDLKDLKAIQWQGLVLDEAQNIKNPEAKQSQAVRELKSDFRFALTGTPVENRLTELWSIMDFLNPNYLGPRNFFQRRFATPIERYGDTASLQTLRGLVQPFILRRLKTDRSIIQDLPDKQEMTVFCGLSAEQGRLYQKVVDESLAEINDAEGVQRRGLILGLLVKLKQICNHPAQFLKQASLGTARRSAKLQRLDEMLEELLDEGDRALIFTQFAEWGKLLQKHLNHKLQEEPLFLYGSTSQTAREAMVDRFQHDPNGPRLFILSLKAGGVGLNLTRANHVFHFDRWWNPAVENQATDRAFRIGQTRNVQVHKFVCTGTLEERINDMIESKKALAEQVVGAGEQWLTELDTDQLRDLLTLDRNAVIDES